MMNFKEKNISIKLMVFSLFGIIISSIIKEPYRYFAVKWAYCLEKNIDVPIHYFKIDILGFQIQYKTAIVVLIVVMALGVYWFLTKTDAELKKIFTKCFDKILSIDLYRTLDKIYSFKIKENNIKGEPEVNTSTIEVVNLETKKVKRRTLFIGFIFLILSLFEYYAISNKTDFYLYALLLMLVQKFFAATVCNRLKGGSWLWFIFGFAIPSVALILTSLSLSSKKEIQYEK